MSARVAAPVTYAVHGACIRGVEAFPVTVEVSASGGIPGISIVGMADAAVLEARSRIRCALRATGFEIPRSSFTVNLAPGDIRKTGSGLDLPIAVAVLALSGQIPMAGLDGCLFVGELGLDGSVGGVRGEVAYQLLARDAGLSFVGGLMPSHVAIADVRQGYLPDLGTLRAGVDDALRGFPAPLARGAERSGALDYSDVLGQEVAKRGIAVAATGGLGMLMIGSPGAGKTMLARRMTSIFPSIEEQELQEALCIHSVADEPTEALLRGERPFRSPHHSVSSAGLVGGGRPVRPGEISLAHGGVLFLDELAEFSAQTLQMLRQPIEDGFVRIVRADGAYRFPSRFQLLAASNPCPCGYLGDREVACRCSDAMVERYRAKLAGPLADRIDLILNVARPDPEVIVRGAEGLSTAEMRAEVERGRAFRAWREHKVTSGSHAALGSLESMTEVYALDDEARETLIGLAHRAFLTGRGLKRLCRIARTVADMAESACVEPGHLLEASMLQGRRGDGRM